MSHDRPTNPIQNAPPALVLEIMRKASVCVQRGDFTKALEVIAQLDAYRSETDVDPDVLAVVDSLRAQARAGLDAAEPRPFGVLKRRPAGSKPPRRAPRRLTLPPDDEPT